MNESSRPLIAHVVHRFATGGLENGVVNLINHMPEEEWRHAVIAVTQIDPSFARRIRRNDVRLVELHKAPGQGLWLYPRLVRLFRELRPAVVHTRNLGTLEFQLPAALAGVPGRVHGEHGWDMDDLGGKTRRHRWLRRLYSPWVHRYVALSRELESYLHDDVGIEPTRVERICNGVDVDRFRPANDASDHVPDWPFERGRHWVIGTVGRMQPVKNQTLLVRAFIAAIEASPSLRSKWRLALVGDGPLRAEACSLLAKAGLSEMAWVPGERADVPLLMRCMDAFVLPSLAEGVSNTILEAMATGLTVVATDVGANADLVAHDTTGLIVPSDNVSEMALALGRLAGDTTRAQAMGREARRIVESNHSLTAMTQRYAGTYRAVLTRSAGTR